MAHAQKPDFIFQRSGWVHLNQHGCQLSSLLAAEVCASVIVMLDTPCSEVVWRLLWLPTPFISFLFTSPPVRHCVPLYFNWTLPSTLAPRVKWPRHMLTTHLHQMLMLRQRVLYTSIPPVCLHILYIDLTYICSHVMKKYTIIMVIMVTHLH
jgi:hypothetical protein